MSLIEAGCLSLSKQIYQTPLIPLPLKLKLSPHRPSMRYEIFSSPLFHTRRSYYEKAYNKYPINCIVFHSLYWFEHTHIGNYCKMSDLYRIVFPSTLLTSCNSYHVVSNTTQKYLLISMKIL